MNKIISICMIIIALLSLPLQAIEHTYEVTIKKAHTSDTKEEITPGGVKIIGGVFIALFGGSLTGLMGGTILSDYVKWLQGDKKKIAMNHGFGIYAACITVITSLITLGGIALIAEGISDCLNKTPSKLKEKELKTQQPAEAIS